MNKKIDNLATVFWNLKGVLLVEFMLQGTAMNTEAYCATLRWLWHAIQNRQRGLLSSTMVLLQDNAHPPAAARMQAMLQEVG
jgi:hypothetical protein